MKRIVWSTVVMLLGVGGASTARADLIIALQEAGVNAGARTNVATGSDFGSVTFTGTYGDFSLTIFGAASQNNASLSFLHDATVTITNNGTSTHTLQLWATQNNYSLPAGTPLRLESGLGGSITSGTLTLAGIFQAFFDRNNNLFGTGDQTNGLQNASLNVSTFDTGSATSMVTRTGLYSLTSDAVITLTAGGTINFSAHADVAPGVPAPAGFVLLGMSAPLVGAGYWLRRRKVKA